VFLPFANQALAELSHGSLVRNYEWMYPLLTTRRATTSVPLGAFPWDHEAKQGGFALLREEGRAFARACSGNLLVFAEEPHYMMMSLVEGDRTVRLSSLEEANTRVVQALSSRCTAAFVEKQAPSHRDMVREFLDAGRYEGWPIYFQEARRNPYDRTEVPAERRYCIDSPAGRGCLPVALSH
jgi:hypothetical protein